MDDTGFYAVYCLESEHPKHRGRSYIGFTVDPLRRLRQHNGFMQNGAQETSRRRPWKMLFCVHGFPAKVTALQFEWAWQHPTKARGVRDRLADLPKNAITTRDKFRVLYHLLRCSPFDKYTFGLYVFETARFNEINAAVREMYPDLPELPSSSTIEYGAFEGVRKFCVATITTAADDVDSNAPNASPVCTLCDCRLDATMILICLADCCDMQAHPHCLADAFNDPNHVVPQTTIACPICPAELEWHAVVHRSKARMRQKGVQDRARIKKELANTRRRQAKEERAFTLSQLATAAPLEQQDSDPGALFPAENRPKRKRKREVEVSEEDEEDEDGVEGAGGSGGDGDGGVANLTDEALLESVFSQFGG